MTPELVNLLDELKDTSGPNRKLDYDLALVAGYRREIASARDRATGEERRQILWFHPNSAQTRPINPTFFTANLDGAKRFLDLIAPELAVAVSWDMRTSKFEAVLEGCRRVQGATPAIAICIAGVDYLLSSRQIAG